MVTLDLLSLCFVHKVIRPAVDFVIEVISNNYIWLTDPAFCVVVKIIKVINSTELLAHIGLWKC